MWRRAALLSVFLDPGLVFGFGSFGPWAAFAGSLELAAHFLVQALSLACVFSGEKAGVVGVDRLLIAELER